MDPVGISQAQNRQAAGRPSGQEVPLPWPPLRRTRIQGKPLQVPPPRLQVRGNTQGCLVEHLKPRKFQGAGPTNSLLMLPICEDGRGMDGSQGGGPPQKARPAAQAVFLLSRSSLRRGHRCAVAGAGQALLQPHGKGGQNQCRSPGSNTRPLRVPGLCSPQAPGPATPPVSSPVLTRPNDQSVEAHGASWGRPRSRQRRALCRCRLGPRRSRAHEKGTLLGLGLRALSRTAGCALLQDPGASSVAPWKRIHPQAEPGWMHRLGKILERKKATFLYSGLKFMLRG